MAVALDHHTGTFHVRRRTDEVNPGKLANALEDLDVAQVKRRRAVYTRLYHEACLAEEVGKGISFSAMLQIIAHYTLLTDEASLE